MSNVQTPDSSSSRSSEFICCCGRVCKPTAETGTAPLNSISQCLLDHGTYQVGIHATDVTSKMRHTTAPAQLADYELQDIGREGASTLLI